MTKNVETFVDFIKRGKFLSLHGIWVEMDPNERSFARGEILKLSQEIVDKMKRILSATNKSFYTELFEKQEKNQMDGISPEIDSALSERFSVIKTMLDSCKGNAMLLDILVKKLAKYPNINDILHIIKNMDESIHDKIVAEIMIDKTESDDDLFGEDLVNSDFVRENILRCKMKARILSEYHNDLTKQGVIPQIVESLLMQESYNLDNSEEYADFSGNLQFEREDDDDDDDDDDQD